MPTGLRGGGAPAVVRRQGTVKPKHDAPAATKRPPNSTQQKHRSQGQGNHRADLPFNYGPPDTFPDLARSPKFRFALVKATGDIFELDRIEAATWDDSSAILTGTLQLRDAVFATAGGKIPSVDEGDRVICEVDEGHGFSELWVMRLYRPQLISANDGTRSFELANDLDLARRSEAWFRYKADKAHPHGWYGHEIIEDVCKRFNIPIGGMYVSTKRFQLVVKRCSPLEIIRNIVLKERRKAGRRLVVRFEHGRIYVLPLQRSAHLLALGPTLIDATMKSQLPDEFASAVTVRGITDNGQGGLFTYFGGQKAHGYLESAASIARFGYVHRIFFSPDARTDAELLAEAKSFLTAVAKPVKTLTLTHRGMPRLRRGDAIMLSFGDESLRKQVVWVYEVQHSLVAGRYEMTVTVIFDDPFVPRRQKIYFKLKATQDEAIGNRARLNPTWFVPKGNKDDLTGDTGASSPQGRLFEAHLNQTGGG